MSTNEKRLLAVELLVTVGGAILITSIGYHTAGDWAVFAAVAGVGAGIHVGGITGVRIGVRIATPPPVPEKGPRMIPRWVVDSNVTKKVAARVGAWALGCVAAVWLALSILEVQTRAAGLLVTILGLLVGLAGSHLSTKRLRSLEAPADEWLR